MKNYFDAGPFGFALIVIGLCLFYMSLKMEGVL